MMNFPKVIHASLAKRRLEINLVGVFCTPIIRFYMEPDTEPAIILRYSSLYISTLCLKWFTVR